MAARRRTGLCKRSQSKISLVRVELNPSLLVKPGPREDRGLINGETRADALSFRGTARNFKR